MGDTKSSNFEGLDLPNNSGELLAARNEASMSRAERAAADARAREANRALMKDVFGKRSK